MQTFQVRRTLETRGLYEYFRLTPAGFHDSNNARVKAAEDYMYQCEEIFVVADITRVGTNKNVDETLEKCLGRNLKDGGPSQGVVLVCT